MVCHVLHRVDHLQTSTVGTVRVGAAYPDRCSVTWEWVLSDPDIFPDFRMEIYPWGILGASGVHDGELQCDAGRMDRGSMVSQKNRPGQGSWVIMI